MANILVTETADLPADTVWELVADFGNLSWAPGIDKQENIGEGIGMIRRLHIKGMGAIDEVLETCNHDNMTMSYTIPQGLPLPLDNYRATAKVVPINDGQCRIEWRSDCMVKSGTNEEDAKKLLEQTYKQLIGWIISYLSKQQ